MANKAIDFIDTPMPETCDCCFGSQGRPAWWRIDFGASYPIETIIFIGRNDGKTVFSKMKLTFIVIIVILFWHSYHFSIHIILCVLHK